MAEMRHRHEHGNPPYSRLIRLLHSHTNNAVCESRARELAETLRAAQRGADLTNIDVLGLRAVSAKTPGQVSVAYSIEGA